VTLTRAAFIAAIQSGLHEAGPSLPSSTRRALLSVAERATRSCFGTYLSGGCKCPLELALGRVANRPSEERFVDEYDRWINAYRSDLGPFTYTITVLG
jgi:hypothetical protein